MKDYFIFFDNEFIRQSEAKIPVLSASSQFGLNVFEGIRVYKEDKFHIFRLTDHLKRLQNSLLQIGLCTNVISEDSFLEIVKELIHLNEINSDFSIRFTYLISKIDSWSSMEAPTFFIAPMLKEKNTVGVKKSAVIVDTKRISQDSMNPKIKCGANYINGRYATMEAISKGAEVPIMKNHMNFISESSGACIFMVKEGKIYTPSLDCDILESITRDTLIKIFQENNFIVEERPISEEEVLNSNELFLCGSAAEVTPIRLLNKEDNEACEITNFIFHEYHNAVSGKSYLNFGWITSINCKY